MAEGKTVNICGYDIPWDERYDIPCCFGDSMYAMGRYSTPGGCLCRRDDREQDLCAQHLDSAEPLSEEGMSLILVYNKEFYQRYLKGRVK